ncbi:MULTISPECIES: hypothetical protein [unclassified Mesorhizobium]|uniref:hypothetical protein n=1 Tax=unclassified Mesorhizobium TaxID=325217 RepID=UPI000FC9EBBB|nr:MULTISPECIES: hypothetical protein [unclassified Mesorhizobium]TGP24991.1 hypothetical protein EN874_007705 [Mesorhizobium sp. M1D.F.Ca.ET.231.01.1.1]TGP36315.1 hypothetical protein EN877_07705 [Mesorhizobium sp. M1D.F.Ca.ET.234.01.1.1]TGS49818.1 hypothetical protein EN827_07705 [Mesorhizobium sp. M1D.F.Ca.ET.184.01.1.1]TGS64529.1 hypothetical protein EN826_007705 [Mesorhizobium sp. M1D.F.Ca.ET.183.01.1.1]
MPNVPITRRNMLSGSVALTAGLMVSDQASAALSGLMPSRQEKIKACIEQLNDLLCEETGMTWEIYIASDQTVTFNDEQRPRQLASHPKWFRGLHDPTGVAGPPLMYGDPVKGYVCRREDGPDEGTMTYIVA